MNNVANIATLFPKYLFWDMDAEKLDVRNDKDIIIPRALFATTEATFIEDISRLEQIYNRSEIVAELSTTKERISDKVCVMVAQRYHIKKFFRYK